MFQRIRGAIDRTIAEEQARQKAEAERQPAATRPSGSVSRSASNASQPSRTRARKSGHDLSRDGANSDPGLNPDPAVFEAAFVIDDTDDMSRGPSPRPASIGREPGGTETGQSGEVGEETKDHPPSAPSGTGAARESAAPEPPVRTGTPARAVALELPPDVRSKLRKLEKLEATYPELLRSYRIAHGRATSIEPFEKALRENTPLTSIKDPDALVEYLSQLSLKGDMVMDELKRVSAEKDSFKKKLEDADKEAASLRGKVAALKANIPSDDGAREPAGVSQEKVSSSGSKQEKGKLGITTDATGDEDSQDLFSYDNEIPQLQAEVEAKSEELARLKAEVESLKSELSTAKETSVGLMDSLEKATKELSEVREAGAARDSFREQLEARNAEIASLSSRLDEAQSQLRELERERDSEKERSQAFTTEQEAKQAVTRAQNSELEAELTMSVEAKMALDNKVDELTKQIESLETRRAEDEQAVAELKRLQAGPTTLTSEPQSTPTPAAGTSKKNKKKKKKAGAGAGAQADPPVVDLPDRPVPEDVQAQIAGLQQEIAKKDDQIEKLSKQRKTEDDLREEIETLQENLLNIGQDHVEAKQKIKGLEAEKATLKECIADLEERLSASIATAETSSAMQKEYASLKQEYDDLKAKSSTLQSDLGAAQQLAQSRYKDLTDLREILQKAQPELKSLRQDSAALKTAKEELAAKSEQLHSLEKKEKELRAELTRAERLAADREVEIKSLREKLAVETNTRLRLEDAQRVSGRDLRRAEADKIELSAKEEKASRELQRLQEEVTKVKPRLAELEAEAAKLRKETTVLREEAELKTSQYANAQNLLGSMRDQMAELSIQLKESQGQAESLDEELAECRKLLGERTREAETMRRLLADVDERADNKVREMRARLDAAVEERDRLEDEASSLARRKSRESEELKQRIRELEKEVKTLADEKDELEHREREWRRRREELEAVEQKADAEVGEMQSAVSNLRATLDASEQQVRDAEKAKADLRRMLDDYRIRYDKLTKESKALQARLGNGVGSSGRSSIDSTRSGATNGAAGQQLAGTDAMYLKTILLQFLEQKDNRLRAQLVPVLGKLLKFDKSDEQKWMAAVQHIALR